jgi:hypothetical protein
LSFERARENAHTILREGLLESQRQSDTEVVGLDYPLKVFIFFNELGRKVISC